MEKVYPRVAKTGKPEVFLREGAFAVPGDASSGVGRETRPSGRIIYFPWDIDRTFWEVLCVDHFKLLRNAVEWATNEAPLVIVTGPGVLDVTLWRQKDSITVHLVNLTNQTLRTERAGHYLTFTVPTILDHEVVAIDF